MRREGQRMTNIPYPIERVATLTTASENVSLFHYINTCLRKSKFPNHKINLQFEFKTGEPVICNNGFRGGIAVSGSDYRKSD